MYDFYQAILLLVCSGLASTVVVRERESVYVYVYVCVCVCALCLPPWWW